MSNPLTDTTAHEETTPRLDAGATFATTVVRADAAPDAQGPEKLHPRLQTQLKELRLRSGQANPDVPMLLKLISNHYETQEDERRGIVRSMQLMADEARALARQVEERQSESAQVILDHVKETVLTVDESGIIRSFNAPGERVFDYSTDQIIGQRLDLLVPQIADRGSVAQGLERLAAAVGDTNLDLAPREIWGRRRGGEVFPAEITVSRAQLSPRDLYVVCLRDISSRREAELALRESEARYRMLVDHAPDAIVVLDADSGKFVDVNANAERLFGLDREALLTQGPVSLSPEVQPDGTRSSEAALRLIERALAGEPQIFEWLHCDGQKRPFICEVRLLHLPSNTKRLVRGSITDISERKRAERVASAERDVLQGLTARVPLPEVLESITRLLESVGVASAASISLLGTGGVNFSAVIAPRLPASLRDALARAVIGIRNGSCAASVYLGRPVQVADIGKDPFWQHHRAGALAAGLRAAWSTPIKTANGKMIGSLGAYRTEPGLPSDSESRVMDRAAQLAGIAIERLLAEEALLSSEAKFRGLFESIAEGVYQSSCDGRVLTANPAFLAILGYADLDELRALPGAQALYWNPADRAFFMRRIEAEGEIRGAEFAMRRRDGSQVVVLETARPMRDSDGRITGYEGTIIDITARKRAEQAVFAEKERAQVTLQSIGDAVISTCARGMIEYMNPVAEKLTGWRAEEAIGRPVGEVLVLIDEVSHAPIADPVRRLLERHASGSAADHAMLVTRGGDQVAIQESSAPIRDRTGVAIGAVIVLHDVTKERRLKRALSYQASHDALTGLINRREFEGRLHAAVAAAQRGEKHGALLYVDLDQFKVVNDTCGHQAGDRLMRDITGLLQTRVRSSDTIARLGGDEFGILLDHCTLEQAAQIADGVRQAIHSYRFVWDASTLSVGASVGVVEIGRETQSVASLMSAADIACYAAKDEGRNRVHVSDARGVLSRHKEMQWVARVTHAAEQGQLELFFQPIVGIGSSGSPAFHELTVRLRNGSELVSPTEFIPAAERYNVMPLIDRWVVLRATQLLREKLARNGTAPLLAVNLSGTSLNDQTFLDFVLEHAGDAMIARSLCFEITETAAVTNLANALYFMRELQARGCKFSLDDFGTGLSSFMYLKTLPVDYLKIDGGFVSNVATSPVDRSMVDAISKIGRALGISTVAECVETKEVLEELKRIGVDYVQGFYLARPRPIAELDT